MIKDVYNSLAKQYDAMYQDEKFKKEDQDLIQLIKPYIKGDVLDVGCGTGLLLEYIKIQPERYLGCDVSKVMISIFRKKFPAFTADLFAFEDFHRFQSFDSIVALYGSASYIKQNSYNKFRMMLEKRGFIFLMFYKPGYYPNFYTAKQKEFIKKNVDWDVVKQIGFNMYYFNNYIVVTNKKLGLKRYA